MVIREEMELLFKKDISKLTDENVWIWGAGNTTQLYQEGLDRLKEGELNIQGYIDQNAGKMNYEFRGKKVIEPAQIEDGADICVLICTIRTETIKSIRELCKIKKLKNYLLDEVILTWHKDEVMRCFDSLCDERSKSVYYELTKARIKGDKLSDFVNEGNQYFCVEPFGMQRADEVFLDCGAYVGDTVCEYLRAKKGVFKKIIAFEPDKYNFEKLEKTVENQCKEWNMSKDKFEVYPYAIGEKSINAKFEHYENNSGIGSKVVEHDSSKGDDCKVISIDEFLTEPYSFLKADIESFEYKMLLGAKESIKENKPLLAICIYHNVVDFYSIPLLIKEILPEYKLAVRHHREDTSDTIVYAWV